MRRAESSSGQLMRSPTDPMDDYASVPAHEPPVPEEVVEDQRTVDVEPVPDYEVDYPSNSIRTTKYSPITFLPVNLFHQFRRLANFYFLIICLIQLVPGVTPIPPITSILPLVFVLGVTAIKEAYEDYKRYKADKEVNTRTVTAIIQGEFTAVTYQDVVVGHLVYLEQNEEVPADMVLLACGSPVGNAFVETSSLDGETNLKLKNVPPPLSQIGCDQQEIIRRFRSFRATVTCLPPTELLDQFEGHFKLREGSTISRCPLTLAQFLLRGSRLKNTPFAIGLVVYTGPDTKLVLNMHAPPSKRSNVEKRLNTYLIYIFLTLMALCLASSLVSYFVQDSLMEAWYLELDDLPTWQTVAKFITFSFLTFLILYNVFIPISLYVCVEMSKFVGAMLIEWDRNMYDEEMDQPCIAKTSNINEELGQVQYVFSDKTGTLTRNEMVFKKASIGNVVYDGSVLNDGDKDMYAGQNERSLREAAERPEVAEFLLALAVCHSVFVEQSHGRHMTRATPDKDYLTPERKMHPGDTKLPTYQASSPDEEALLVGAARMGVMFWSRDNTELTVKVQGVPRHFEVLQSMAFDSDRKRMSVIVRDIATGAITLYSKGADSSIWGCLEDAGPIVDAPINAHLHQFSNLGLRTLLVASRPLDKAVYDAWASKHRAAEEALSDRTRKVAESNKEMEKSLNLLGASAIEDRLQEGVPDVIDSLIKAGIKVWVLTGDKQETAISIGHSCALLTARTRKVIINADSADRCAQIIQEGLRQLGAPARAASGRQGERQPLVGPKPTGERRAVIIDGATLKFALEDDLKLEFLRLCSASDAVICCRVSPLQKALVVRLVKQNSGKNAPVTLAIGDGGNDVSMIQEADVGIGIMGREGRQAARSSDYCIAKFKFLKRLLLVHGRYSYIRVVALIQYSFYKNIAFTLPQFYFAFSNAFSGQTLVDGMLMTIYNMIFTFWPIMIYSVLEQDLSPEELYRYPGLYRQLQDGDFFNYWTVSGWFASAVWHSIAMYFGTVALFAFNSFAEDGQGFDIWSMGTTVCTLCVVIVTLRTALATKHFTLLSHVAIWGSLVVYAAVISFYCWIPNLDPWNMYFIIYRLAMEPSWWLGLLLIIGIALLPDFLIIWTRIYFKPRPHDIVREVARAPASGYEAPMPRKAETPEDRYGMIIPPSPLNSAGIVAAQGAGVWSDEETAKSRSVGRANNSKSEAPGLGVVPGETSRLLNQTGL